MFNWIRKRVYDAVLAGVADAAEALARQGAGEAEDGEARLERTVRLLPAAPAPAQDNDEVPDAVVSVPGSTTGNGRKRRGA